MNTTVINRVGTAIALIVLATMSHGCRNRATSVYDDDLAIGVATDLHGYVLSHAGMLPANWQELQTWLSHNGKKSLPPSDVKSRVAILAPPYQIIDTLPRYVVARDNKDTATAELLNRVILSAHVQLWLSNNLPATVPDPTPVIRAAKDVFKAKGPHGNRRDEAIVISPLITNGMERTQVREILGDPDTSEGGFYSWGNNGGIYVHFSFDGKVLYHHAYSNKQ